MIPKEPVEHDPTGLQDALSELLGVHVDLHESAPQRYALRDIPNLAGPADSSAVAVYLRAAGVFQGQILLILPPQSARRIGDLMLGPGKSSEHVLDACRELGNIVASRYLSRMADAIGGRAIPSTPLSTVDMAGAVISSVLQRASHDPVVHAIELRMQAAGDAIRGTVLVLQDQTSEA